MSNPLRKARLDKEWNVTELAKRSGVAASTISEIENGLKVGRALTIRKLAKALEIPEETLDTLIEKPGMRKRATDPNSTTSEYRLTA